MKGLLITLEGIEGSGKSTQAKLLSDWLSSLGVVHILTRDPGGTFLAEKVRNLLLSSSNIIHNRAEVYLYLAARVQLVEEVIRPALNSGKTVICDRFSDSFLAYQGFARGFDLDYLKSLNSWATGELSPSLTVLLDIPVTEAFNRVKAKGFEMLDRIESEDYEFHEKVREGFLALAKEEPERIKIINAAGTQEEVFSNVVLEVSKIFAVPA